MKKSTMRIRVSAPDDRVADRTVSLIMDAAKRSDTGFRGPIPLPRKGEKENRREIDVVKPDFRFTEKLDEIDVPSTADVEISFI